MQSPDAHGNVAEMALAGTLQMLMATYIDLTKFLTILYFLIITGKHVCHITGQHATSEIGAYTALLRFQQAGLGHT